MSGRTRTKTDTRSGHFNDGDASMMITMMMMMITKVMMIIMIVIVIAKVMMKTIAKIMPLLFSGL